MTTNKAKKMADQLGQVVTDEGNLQSEIDRLQKPAFVELEQVLKVHEWLENKRRARQCGRIVGESRTGKTFSCQSYVFRHKPITLPGQAPTIPVLRIQPPQECSPKDLFTTIIKELKYRIDKGTVSDLRSRTYHLLTTCKVEILVIDEADRIKPKTFADVRDLFDKLNLSVVLVGTERLNAVIKRDEQVYNRFRASYTFGKLSATQLAEVIAVWEEEILCLPAPSNLTKRKTFTTIAKATGGYIGLMDTILREAAIRSLKRGLEFIDETILQEVVDEYK